MSFQDLFSFFFFFNDTATTEIYTLSLHDALPISTSSGETCAEYSEGAPEGSQGNRITPGSTKRYQCRAIMRSEEHTSELQSRLHLVCRLLLEKKKKNHNNKNVPHIDASD